MIQLRNHQKAEPSLSRGMTLIELLIVIAIIVLLASVTLPSMKTILKDRKTNQATMQIRAYIESAKTRAITKNREVAVVVERMNVDPLEDEATKYVHRNSSIRLSMADVLPPYRGDLEFSTVNLLDTQSTIAPYNYQSGSLPLKLNVVTMNLDANPTARYFLNLGDQIAFDDHPRRFEIVNITPFPITAGDSTATITIWNQNYNYSYVGTNRQGTFPKAPVANLVPGQHRFRLYSKPRRLFAKMLDLPKGTCVDLSLSGVGTSGRGFSTELLNDVAGLDAPATPQPASFFKPVYIVFNSRGSVSCLYGNGPGAATMERYLPAGNIHLFVGRTDQVYRCTDPTDLDPMSAPNDIDRLVNSGTGANDPYLPNLADSSAYWVKIAPESGQVSSAPHLDPRTSGFTSISEMLNYGRGLSTIGNDISAK